MQVYLRKEEQVLLKAKLSVTKVPRNLVGSLHVRPCGWLLDSRKDMETMAFYDVRIDDIPKPHICGKIITSDKIPSNLPYNLPRSKEFVHMRFLCTEHRWLFHEKLEKHLGIYPDERKMSDITPESNTSPTTGRVIWIPPPSAHEEADRKAEISAKKNQVLDAILHGNHSTGVERKKRKAPTQFKKVGKIRRKVDSEHKSNPKQKSTTDRSGNSAQSDDDDESYDPQRENEGGAGNKDNVSGDDDGSTGSSESSDSDDESDDTKPIVSNKKKSSKKKAVKRGKIMIPVCPLHDYPTAYLCAYMDGGSDICGIPVCQVCQSDRNRVLAQLPKGNILNKVCAILCNRHFKSESTNIYEGGKETRFDYSNPISVFTKVTNDSINITGTRNEANEVSYAKVPTTSAVASGTPSTEEEIRRRTALRAEADSGIFSRNLDIILRNQFNFEELIRKVTSEEYKIPNVLPNMVKGKKMRINYKNRIFIHNFVGICIWKFMNDNDSWVRPKDLNTTSHPDTVSAFQRHVDTIKERHPEIWKLLHRLQISTIDASSLHHFCHNTKALCKLGVWNLESTEEIGIWHKFYDILREINFRMSD